MTDATDAVCRVNGPGPLGKLARLSSVIHLPILLTVIPSVGLPVFSLSFIRDRNDRVASADWVARGLREAEAEAAVYRDKAANRPSATS